MKKILFPLVIIICIMTSMLSDSMAVYTKTLPPISGTITAKSFNISDYPLWSYEKELQHQYRIYDIVQYNGKIYKRKDSGFFNYKTPDENKCWVLIG
ncbi:hypothetical protein EHE19_010390 [Ruminiclostridium herbifermentans]|uniref:Uncharacterized protein n=1 Tax=Ruminiclostridium herbifermentans TaxID=2488810 RepID=A0A4U7JIP7_9FIRM|nr:hypothetical protein [Ruminiclostridium herbifermentans]QNU65349.1 hypothetical protein EHE19_010390 [Ruminiclostridium herbifermentans]